MRILKTKFYVTEERRKDVWGAWELTKERRIISGLHAQGSKRIYVISEATIHQKHYYRLYDGHVIEHCPIVMGDEAIKFLTEQPYQQIEELDEAFSKIKRVD
jgi:hypothetical protein